MEHRPAKWLALGLFLALSAAIGGLALGRMDKVAQTSAALREQPFTLADALLRAHHHVHHLQSALHELTLAGDRQRAQSILQRMTDDDAGLTTALNIVVAQERDDQVVLSKLVRTLAAWRETRERVSELIMEGRWHDAAFLQNSEGESRYNEILESLDAALEAERRHAVELRQEAESARRSAEGMMIVLAVLAGGALTATGLGLAALVGTYRPLRRLRSSLLALAGGDTEADIPYVNASSTVGAMARAIACFRQSMIERDAAHSALRLSEERLRDAVADAELANAAKSRFLAAASHDLRQPLQALRLYLDTLDRRIDDPLDRRILTGALLALEAGEELLSNYLDVSVLESGIVQPSVGDLRINDLLSDLFSECMPLAQDKGLRFKLTPCAAVVRSDAALLRRLLRNLLTNAIRYTAKGGVLVGCRRRGKSLRIEVWDTGIGIAADQLQAIFEDFYQVDNAARDRTKGLGLGLSMVDRAARLLGHDIRVQSRPGQGSMFAVTVPLVGETGGAKRTLAAA